MIKPQLLALAFCAFSSVEGSIGQPALGLSEFRGDGFVVSLPKGIKGHSEARVDFQLSNFTREDGRLLLTAYSGLHPSFGTGSPSSALYSEGVINGMKTKQLKWKSAEGKDCGEVLVAIRTSGRMIFSAHFSYCLESDADVEIAEAIIQSIRPGWPGV